MKRKTYDLSTASDSFLQQHAGASFPAAVEANEKELAEVSQRELAIRSRPDFARLAESDPTLISASSSSSFATASGNGTGTGSAMDGGGGGGQQQQPGRDLSEAIESLPELLHRKALLDAHTTVMQNVMRQVAAREIPTFFELEQSMLSGGARAVDKAAVLALLRDASKVPTERTTTLYHVNHLYYIYFCFYLCYQ
jgi:sec1 family domain-containing protein 1